MDLSQLRRKGDVAPPNSKPQKAASMAEHKSEETKRYSADGCLFTLPHVVLACVWWLQVLAPRRLAFDLVRPLDLLCRLTNKNENREAHWRLSAGEGKP